MSADPGLSTKLAPEQKPFPSPVITKQRALVLPSFISFILLCICVIIAIERALSFPGSFNVKIATLFLLISKLIKSLT